MRSQSTSLLLHSNGARLVETFLGPETLDNFPNDGQMKFTLLPHQLQKGVDLASIRVRLFDRRPLRWEFNLNAGESTKITTGDGDFFGKLLELNETPTGTALWFRDREGKQFYIKDVRRIKKTTIAFFIEVIAEQTKTPLSSATLDYVCNAITTAVHYDLRLGPNSSVLEQILETQNDTESSIPLNKISFNTAALQETAHIQRYEETSRAMMTAGPNEALMGVGTEAFSFTTAQLTLERGRTFFPSNRWEISALDVRFEAFLSARGASEELNADPVVRFPRRPGLVEGMLALYDSNNNYLTGGRLVMGSTHAKAKLQPLHYGLRIGWSTEFTTDSKKLKVDYTITCNSSAPRPTYCTMKCEKQLRFAEIDYVLEDTKQIELQVAPGRSKLNVTLMFIPMTKE
jgi:hypothetical protein